MQTKTLDKTKLINWLNCKDELLKIFTEKEINQALKDSNYTLSDLTTYQNFKYEPTHLKIYDVINDRYQFTIKKYLNNGYYKEVDIVGYDCRVISNYQGLKHDKLIFNLLKNKFKWFNNFYKIDNITKTNDFSFSILNNIPEKYHNMTISELLYNPPKEEIKKRNSLWSIYEISDFENYEIYLNTEFGSLYVPIMALIKKDFSIIEKRMKEYFSWYYNLNGNKKKKLEKALMTLKSKEAKQLKKYLDNEVNK